MLEIRKAGNEDLARIMEIYGIAQEYMISHGNPTQWAHHYPSPELINDDIRKGNCYLVVEENIIHGVFVLCEGEEPTYAKIFNGAWFNNDPYVTIHRIASDGAAHGIFHCVVEYAKSKADNVRIDTHENNLTMQHLIEKNGFVKCGTITVRDGSPRVAFQWVRNG